MHDSGTLKPLNAAASSSARPSGIVANDTTAFLVSDAGDTVPVHEASLAVESTASVLAQEVRRLTARLKQQEHLVAKGLLAETELQYAREEIDALRGIPEQVPAERSRESVWKSSVIDTRASEARADAAAARRKALRQDSLKRGLELAIFRARSFLDTAIKFEDGVRARLDKLVVAHHSERSAFQDRLDEAERVAAEGAEEVRIYACRVDDLQAQLDAANASFSKISEELCTAIRERDSWQKKAQLADEKFANALAEMESNAERSVFVDRLSPSRSQPGLGTMFSPAPLAGKSLNKIGSAPGAGEDIASESRSRFTGTLPFNLDALLESPSPRTAAYCTTPSLRAQRSPPKRPRAESLSIESKGADDSKGSAVAISKRGKSQWWRRGKNSIRSVRQRSAVIDHDEEQELAEMEDNSFHSAAETVSEDVEGEEEQISRENDTSRAGLHTRQTGNRRSRSSQTNNTVNGKEGKLDSNDDQSEKTENMSDLSLSPPKKKSRKPVRPTSLLAPNELASPEASSDLANRSPHRDGKEEDGQGRDRSSLGRNMRRRKAVSYNYDEPGRDVVGDLDGISLKIRRLPSSRHSVKGNGGSARKKVLRR